VCTDALGQAMMNRGDVDVLLEHAEAALNVGERLVAIDHIDGREIRGALHAWLGVVDQRLRTRDAGALINLDWPRLPVPRASIDMRWF
jgi:hypothetical protein